MPADPRLAALLSANPLFREVPTPVVADLTRAAWEHRLADGQALFSRGDAATDAYVVLTGQVKITTQSANGKAIVVELFQPGDVFGEIGALDQTTRTADALAEGPTTLAVLGGATFRTALDGSARLSLNLLRIVAGRLRRTYSLLEDAAFFTLETRLARQLLHLQRIRPSRTDPARINLHLRQDDLADLLGATTRSIITILNKWRADGIVAYDTNSAFLTVREPTRFAEIATGEP